MQRSALALIFADWFELELRQGDFVLIALTPFLLNMQWKLVLRTTRGVAKARIMQERRLHPYNSGM